MEIAIAGKPNSGKTTFFKAVTLIDAEISSRAFTTIKPNRGVAYVRTECPCKKFDVKCNPNNSKCVNGTRLVPIKVIDIAGLVPDAHLGKGLGNQFLSDIMEADAVINVIDASGSTDMNGNIVASGTHDPKEDVKFFLRELDYWMLGIAKKGVKPNMKKEELISALVKQLSGLKIAQKDVEFAVEKTQLKFDSGEATFMEFISLLRKPIMIAANKFDIPEAKENFDKLTNEYDNVVPCSAEAELALRKAAERGLIKYSPGDNNYDWIITGNLTDQQKEAIEKIKKNIFPMESTGVQDIIDKTVFHLLQMIVVYPVENEHKLSSKKGDVLPDAILLKNGSTALDLAYKVHEDIGKKFISAVDARTKKAIASDYKLKNGDIISIKSGR